MKAVQDFMFQMRYSFWIVLINLTTFTDFEKNLLNTDKYFSTNRLKYYTCSEIYLCVIINIASKRLNTNK